MVKVLEATDTLKKVEIFNNVLIDSSLNDTNVFIRHVKRPTQPSWFSNITKLFI